MNQKLKSENYQNFGGMNNKISQYDNTVFEFINIINMDFQTPGALTQRWGSTQYTTQAFGMPINAIYEYTQLSGSSYVIVGGTGGIWYGATTGNSQGMSFNAFNLGQFPVAGGATVSLQTIRNSRISAANPGLTFSAFDPWYQGNGQFILGGSLFFIWQATANAANNLDFKTLVDWCFFCDGQQALKFNGVTTRPIGLMPVMAAAFNATVNNAGAAATVGMGTATLGSYWYYCSYVNDRGFESEIFPVAAYDNVDPTNAANAPNGGSMGGTFVMAWVDVYTPPIYGITTVNLYAHFGPTMFETANIASPSAIWDAAYVYIGTFPTAGLTTRIALGSTPGNFGNFLANIGPQPDPVVNERQIQFGVSLNALAGNLGKINIIDCNRGLIPNILEVHKDSMFYAGSSAFPSTVVFSDPAEPEGIRVDSNFEVRTNDGDIVTAMKSHQGRLAIAKRNSFHALIGDGKINYDLVEVSQVYGALNKRCIAVYNDILLFLDRKGVIEFNGAQCLPFSNKVQPTFDRMNYSAAINTACMVHDKLRNQILIGIPVDGATVNNFTVIYDYVSNAWATQNSYNPTVFATAFGRNNTKNAFYGTPSGVINWFGPSFLSDNGAGFTTYIQPRFLSDMGNSVEKQFRRLYVDATPNGSTYVLPINFFQDHGTSKVLQTTMVLSQFQNRIDFGIPAKSLSFEMSNFQTSSVFQLAGFTIESRLQRRV